MKRVRLPALAAGEECLVDAGAVVDAEPASGEPDAAIVSPVRSDAVGLWLYELLQREGEVSRWTLIDADGSSFDIDRSATTLKVRFAGPARDTAASVFRHDARNALNAIGMNADLIGMQARAAGIDAISTAAGRLRSGCESLETLISEWTHGGADGGPVDLKAALEFALARQRVEVQVADRSGKAAVSPAVCVAMIRLITEWAAFTLESGVLCLGIGAEGVTVESNALREAAAEDLFCPWYREADSAAPELTRLCPAESLRGRGIGFGVWRARGAAGLRFGPG